MGAENTWIAHTSGELRERLTSLGVAFARHVMLTEGLAGLQDAGLFFPTSTGSAAVGFSTREIPLSEAQRVLRELTTLEALPPKKSGDRTITIYA